jgi:hypothetical protein
MAVSISSSSSSLSSSLATALPSSAAAFFSSSFFSFSRDLSESIIMVALLRSVPISFCSGSTTRVSMDAWKEPENPNRMPITRIIRIMPYKAFHWLGTVPSIVAAKEYSCPSTSKS